MLIVRPGERPKALWVRRKCRAAEAGTIRPAPGGEIYGHIPATRNARVQFRPPQIPCAGRYGTTAAHRVSAPLRYNTRDSLMAVDVARSPRRNGTMRYAGRTNFADKLTTERQPTNQLTAAAPRRLPRH
jgi:hypothetical protein